MTNNKGFPYCLELHKVYVNKSALGFTHKQLFDPSLVVYILE